MKLRPLEPEDLELLYTIENNPELWDSTSNTTSYSRYALKQYLAAMASIYDCGELRLVVETETYSGSFVSIGIVSLHDFSPLEARAEVSIALLKEYRGQGYGQRALSLLEEIAVTRLRIHLLYAYVAVNNNASRNLFGRGGYTCTATLDDWLYIRAKYQQAILFMKIFQKK